MICPKCDSEIKDGSKFCANCGEPLQQSKERNVNSNPITEIDYQSLPVKIVSNNLVNCFKKIHEGKCLSDEDTLRLAIRYELGLGVPVDILKAEQLFAQIENKTNLLLNLYPQKSIEERTGIISDSITIEYKTYFDSEKERELDCIRREKERKEAEQKRQLRWENEKELRRKEIEERRKKEEEEYKKREEQEQKKREIEERRKREESELKKLISEMYSYNKSQKRLSFKLYIRARKEKLIELNKIITAYNNAVKDSEYDKIIFDKEKGLVEGCFTRIYTDKNIGFSYDSAEVVIKLKKKYKNIKLFAIIPCKNQSDRWKEEDKIRYNKILEKVDDKRILYEKYNNYCMQKRNEFMVDNSSLIIACFNEKRGGTQKTINYAKSKDKEVLIINPNDFK